MRELIRQGMERLQAAGVEPARVEAEWLLAQLLHTNPLELHLDDAAVAPSIAGQFLAWVRQRAEGMPLQYLVGDTEFLGHAIRVRPGVFIPRPETEMIVEHALRALRERATVVHRPLRVVDLGTGSGCIAIALAHAVATCAVVGVEVSWSALVTARENVLRHGFDGRVDLVQGRWLTPVRGRVDAIITNPPYVPSRQVDRLPLDVRREPRVSLDGGADGLRDLLEIMAEAPRVMLPGGLLIMECGEEQVEPLARRASTASWVKTVMPLHDLANRPRGILITS